MKDELVKLVMEKTGLAEDKASQATDVVVGFLKKKLPAPVGGQIDALLSGGGAGDQAGKIAGQVSGLLGKKK